MRQGPYPAGAACLHKQPCWKGLSYSPHEAGIEQEGAFGVGGKLALLGYTLATVQGQWAPHSQ